MLTTGEVARRLGVKPATVYAYVSRGLLSSERNADGKGSLFAEADVEAFATGRRRTAPAGDTPAIHTGLTLIHNGRLSYRGHNACELARDRSYESVATLLWTGEPRHVPLEAPAELRELGEAVTAPLPAAARLTDRLRVICAAAAAADPLRFDAAPPAVIATGRTLLATMVEALPMREAPTQLGGHDSPSSHRSEHQHGRPLRDSRRADPQEGDGRGPHVGSRRVDLQDGDGRSPLGDSLRADPQEGDGRGPFGGSRRVDVPEGGDGSRVEVDRRFPFAGTLWPRLTAAAPAPGDLAALNAALVLLADHDIAASTLAARVAASTRAHPYAVVGAGLAALDGPLHGATSGLAYALLSDAVRSGDPVHAISDRLRVDGVIPGFGHPLYPDGDPRAVTLLGLLRDDPARVIIDVVAAAVSRRSGAAPNIDFAIAAFALLNGMGPDAGETIFAVARTAGWIAHALEEYSDRPSRFRPSGRYAGRAPGA